MTERRAATARGPGRVNLIGEHTDYNGGLALPFPIAAGCTVRAEAIDGPDVVAVAEDLGEEDRFPLADVQPADGWRAFVRGMVAELARAGFTVRPTRVTISADVPRGRGLSSSAALEVALALAWLALSGEEDADRVELARLCSRVENDWVGARTGLLDQLAALAGAPGHALRIDFATLALDLVPLQPDGWRLVLLDSGAPHTLSAQDGYNVRRAECERAAAELGVRWLSEADPAAAARLPEPLNRRVEHVLTEDARVDATVAALRAGDLGRRRPAAGRLARQPARPLRRLRAGRRAGARAAAGGRRGGRADDGRRVRRLGAGAVRARRAAAARGGRRRAGVAGPGPGVTVRTLDPPPPASQPATQKRHRSHARRGRRTTSRRSRRARARRHRRASHARR